MSDAPTLPANVELEASILGAMLADNGIIDLTADTLTSADFSEDLHRRVFEAACAQFSQTGTSNPATLYPLFKDDAAMKELGGPSYLAKLTASTTGQLDPKGFALQLAATGRRRRVVEGLMAATETARDPHANLSEAIGLADEAISERSAESIVEEDAADALEAVFQAQDDGETGAYCKIIPTLDHIMGRARPGNLIVLAARPGMGKTAVALSYGRGCAEQGYGTLVASLEMTNPELVERLASDVCYDTDPVPYRDVRDGRLDADQKALVRAAQDKLRSIPLRIASGSSVTLGRLSSLVRRTKRRMEARGQTLSVVIVDYLQLLRTDVRMSSRYETITEISIALKALAKQENVAVVALAQLSRQVEQREDKRPMLSDLRESGQLEQDADVVVFLLRQQYYLQKEEPPKGNEAYVEWQSALASCRDKIEFICAKRRGGVEGCGEGSFFGQYQAVRG
jgi:replicative DNA helicase